MAPVGGRRLRPFLCSVLVLLALALTQAKESAHAASLGNKTWGRTALKPKERPSSSATATTSVAAAVTSEAAPEESTTEELAQALEVLGSPMLGEDVFVEGLEEASSLVVAGIVESFLHKQQLQKGELQCLVKGASKMTGEVTTVAAHTVVLVEQMLGMPSLPGMDSIPDPFSELESAEEGGDDGDDEADYASTEERRLDVDGLSIAMSASALFIELGTSIQSMVQLTHRIVTKCVHRDVLDAMRRASDHVENLHYIGGHLLANGADIVTEVGDAVDQWHQQNFREFGRDIGRALRKVILADDSNASLPEGLPDEAALENITEGFMHGFFGKGFAVDVELPGSTRDIHVDLHRCLSKNMPVFESAWSSVMVVVAKQEAESGGTLGSAKELDDEVSSLLGASMAQLPTVLENCGVSRHQQDMLLDAIEAMGAGIKVHVKVPKTEGSQPQLTDMLSQTLQDWSAHRWYRFGVDLGRLLQDVVVSVFPELYSVDGGMLRKQLAAAGFWGNARTKPVAALLAVPALLLVAKTGSWMRRRTCSTGDSRPLELPVDDVEAVRRALVCPAAE